MKTSARLSVLGAMLLPAVLLVGCGSAPSTSGGAASPSSAYRPCLVSGTGGFHDRSFNQSALVGITDAAKQIGAKPITIESKQATDYKPNLAQMVSTKCNLVVSVGFPLADATKATAEANPSMDFAIIDDGTISLPNVKPILFQTSQAAFLAGYASASYSKTKVVGTFGGMQIPSVTIFMDGFADGVAYYNTQKGADVKVVGWDPASQQGLFTGGFEAGVQAKTVAQGILDQGADVVLPVGGPIFESAGAAIRDSGRPIALIGVDADNYLTSPDLKDLFLTSVMKGVDTGTADAVVAGAKGEFTRTPYVGTLQNGGVGIAPFHDYAGKVSPDLAAELDQVKKDIISGKISVASPSTIK